MNKPLVSVCLITYRHEAYIRQSIEGVLMQKVNFDWELIIAEDNSPDNTRQIVKEYKENHPTLIRLILQEKNVGPGHNFSDLMNAATGKYIAYIEGDDYWKDPYKLQKQVDFLEANPDYGLVCTDALLYNEESKKMLYGTPPLTSTKDISFGDLLVKNRVISLTAVFRVTAYKSASSILNFAEEKGWKMGDYPLWLEMSTFTKLKYFNYISGVYRVLLNSATNRHDKRKAMAFEKSVYSVCDFFMTRHNIQDQSLKVEIKTIHYYKMLKFSFQLKDWREFKEFLQQAREEGILPRIFPYFLRSNLEKIMSTIFLNKAPS